MVVIKWTYLSGEVHSDCTINAVNSSRIFSEPRKRGHSPQRRSSKHPAKAGIVLAARNEVLMNLVGERIIGWLKPLCSQSWHACKSSLCATALLKGIRPTTAYPEYIEDCDCITLIVAQRPCTMCGMEFSMLILKAGVSLNSTLHRHGQLDFLDAIDAIQVCKSPQRYRYYLWNLQETWSVPLVTVAWEAFQRRYG